MAADEAIDAHQHAQAGVRAKLVEIGYVDAPATAGIPGRIQPGWILAHPAVRAAKMEADSLRTRSGERTWQNDNLAALEQIEADLAAVRDRASQV